MFLGRVDPVPAEYQHLLTLLTLSETGSMVVEIPGRWWFFWLKKSGSTLDPFFDLVIFEDDLP